MTTATKTASAIRVILKDYNYWPGSEGDSPLAIKVSSTELTNEKLVSIDKSLRRKANEGSLSFKQPDPATLNISQESLPNIFRTLIQDVFNYNLTDAMNAFNEGDSALSLLESSVEIMEYLVQLYSAFSALQNPKLWRIMAPGDNAAQVNMIIEGTFVSPAETKVIYATTTLYET